MNEDGEKTPTFLFNLEPTEGKAGHIDNSTLRLAIIERLDYIAHALSVLVERSGSSTDGAEKKP